MSTQSTQSDHRRLDDTPANEGSGQRGDARVVVFEVPWTAGQLVSELKARRRARVTGSGAVLRVAEHLATATFGAEHVHLVREREGVEVLVDLAA